MNIIIGSLLISIIALKFQFESAWPFFLCIAAGLLLAPIHNKLLGETKNAPIGVAYLVVVLAAASGIIVQPLFFSFVQIALLFLGGALLYAGFKEQYAIRG
ncbi:MAG: hypothetical protein KKE17_09860 [Proteobacteria bacterium]|nr:hypothetical protein [Pseudomonadota bacterium]MBU1710297.1 hypothetical protein [Pseudomonadota bacterium]